MSGRKKNKADRASMHVDPSSPCLKKLRSSKPDVNVILKFRDDNSRVSQKVYPMYGNNLARISNFFDTSLSVDMREKATGEVILNGIQPELFEKALEFQQDARSIRTMKPKDALDLIGFYHMYEFEGGVELCDDIISEYIHEKLKNQLYKLVDITAMAHQFSLQKSLNAGCCYLNDDVLGEDCHPIRAAMLSDDQVESLLPLFKDDHLILPDEFSEEDLDNALFPKYFVKVMSCRYFAGNKDIRKSASLKLSEASGALSDLCFKFKDDRWVAVTQDGWVPDGAFSISKRDIGLDTCWSIVRDNSNRRREKILWVSPNSEHLDVPPSGPWEPNSEAAEGSCPFLVHC